MIFNKPQTTPYFYIIRHLETKIMYAGSRWANGCHPDEFMKPNGYQTSSGIISKLIKEGGLECFEILRIDTNLDGYSAYRYESSFLQVNDCAASPEWYNTHNNDGKMAFGTETFYQIMYEKYGDTCATRIPKFKDKSKETCMKQWNVENPFQSPIVRKKQIETMQRNWGVDNPSKHPIIQLKKIATSWKNWNVGHPFQSPIVREKVRKTKSERYGDETYVNIEKHIETCMKKFGVTSWKKTPEGREHSSKLLSKTRSEDCEFSCIHCRLVMTSKANLKRWHGDECKMHPTNIEETLIKQEELRIYKSTEKERRSKNNAMNNPIHRKKVGDSKIGRKKFINPNTNEIKIIKPENVSEGFILYSEYKNNL